MSDKEMIIADISDDSSCNALVTISAGSKVITYIYGKVTDVHKATALGHAGQWFIEVEVPVHKIYVWVDAIRLGS